MSIRGSDYCGMKVFAVTPNGEDMQEIVLEARPTGISMLSIPPTERSLLDSYPSNQLCEGAGSTRPTGSIQ